MSGKANVTKCYSFKTHHPFISGIINCQSCLLLIGNCVPASLEQKTKQTETYFKKINDI